MSSTVIQVDSLWKKYRLGVLGTGTLRHDFNRWLHRVAGKPDPYAVVGQAPKIEDRRAKSGDRTAKIEDRRAKIEPPSPAAGAALSPISDLPSPSSSLRDDEMWALRDVSFEVKQGEILGIIGRNGAGKSTLLKILSRVTAPTSGEVRVKGRIASLLEVGTGFHPELTGRENIFLNGAILGMTKAEIKGKLDEIVAFAEIEKFLDTPVKRYSSGMYVRLAFAVAAHLDPEILIVDEVLAVGDVVFQEKCLGKLKEVNRAEGRTVLFVSHNMGAVQTLCSRSTVLRNGRISFDGATQESVSHYLQAHKPVSVVNDLGGHVRNGTGEARIISVRFEDDESNPQTHFRMGEPMNVVVETVFPRETLNPSFGINFVTDTGVMVADCRSSICGLKAGLVKGIVEYRMRIAAMHLYPRTYVVEPWVADTGCISDFDWVRNAATFIVTTGPNFVGGANVNSNHGISFIPTSWNVRLIQRNLPSTSLRSEGKGVLIEE